ncbi:Phosphate transport system permease protein PstC (TC 3.A.1.7.1) [hydrothermal vent metagenome]|uniref:Phosphate transport system permease protein PstC (TC 3.A.1.7.1) n=1 Tax=hydrothermal vent metagenome TaxID=652676 RepID=A0A3B0YTT0_9ZZZZ
MLESSTSNCYSGSAHLRLRLLKDRLTRWMVGAGGMAVIVAILLIFIYLVYIVVPLMISPGMQREANYQLPDSHEVVYLSMEEQAEIGAVIDRNGRVRFLSTADGHEISHVQLPVPDGVKVAGFSAARPNSGVVALGLSNGRALVVKLNYRVSFPNDKRLITPELLYPLGEAPIVVNEDGAALDKLAIQQDESFTLVAWSQGGMLSVLRASPEESLMEDEGSWSFERSSGYTDLEDIVSLLIDPSQRNLYLVSRDGTLAWFDVSDLSQARLREQISVTAHNTSVVSARFLASGNSIMVATEEGRISQWFQVRDETGELHLQQIRSFDNEVDTRALVPEYSRKGFLVAGEDGSVSIYHATAGKRLIRETVADVPVRLLAISPRADALWALSDTGQLAFWSIRNPHPEVSWSALWSKVWYEGYDKPEYVWQSSAADNDFEPKLSLMPLAFGTLKAAFYAMLFAIPLSIFGAIFTAYFMAPKMRQMVKPTIEIMEALPTVILGFLAGLWLAPLVETHLPGLFAMLLLMPLLVLATAWLWHHLPQRLTGRIATGWEAALLIPVILGAGYVSLAASPLLEQWLFGGDMPAWLQNEMGIGFDQRNSLVVGMAMGFAVIPTIFSIAEDAIFSVPRHLTSGSLALGATSWQTLVRVVLLTASPGIFSGIMMGVGRAVGETMIVLMATGNTPLMDLSIFQGMRTLSANIAVEMPEAEVASTHYRILFLAALVLFLFTFVFNTGAELIRQRLRNKYSSL